MISKIKYHRMLVLIVAIYSCWIRLFARSSLLGSIKGERLNIIEVFLIGEDFGQLFISREKDATWTIVKSFCCATSNSAGSVIDAVPVQLQLNLGTKRNLDTKMLKISRKSCAPGIRLLMQC